MASDNTTQYVPDYAVPPGDSLRDVLESLDMTQADLAERIGMSRKTVNLIVQGKAALTPDVAVKLEFATGVPARLWNSLEANYQDALVRVERHESLKAYKDWPKQFPVGEMMERGVIALRDSPFDQVIELLKFFGVASPEDWAGRWVTAQAAYRLDPKHSAKPGALAAWLCQGERRAEAIDAAPYSATVFREVLDKARGLTCEPPAVFQKTLIEFCASAGVALVFVPQYKGTRAHGATKWLSPDKAMIQLSIRRKYADILWFSFFHEAGHLLLHGKKKQFVDFENGDGPEEDQADAFAQEKLIPAVAFDELQMGPYSQRRLEAIADDIGVDVGIVVGRLHHEKLLHYSRLSHLRTKLEWVHAR